MYRHVEAHVNSILLNITIPPRPEEPSRPQAPPHRPAPPPPITQSGARAGASEQGREGEEGGREDEAISAGNTERAGMKRQLNDSDTNGVDDKKRIGGAGEKKRGRGDDDGTPEAEDREDGDAVNTKTNNDESGGTNNDNVEGANSDVNGDKVQVGDTVHNEVGGANNEEGGTVGGANNEEAGTNNEDVNKVGGANNEEDGASNTAGGAEVTPSEEKMNDQVSQDNKEREEEEEEVKSKPSTGGRIMKVVSKVEEEKGKKRGKKLFIEQSVFI